MGGHPAGRARNGGCFGVTSSLFEHATQFVPRERLDARFTANVNTASVVKVIHEYHGSPTSIDTQSIAEALPNRALMAATVTVTNTDDE